MPELKVEIVENVDGKFLILSNDGIGGHLKRGDRWEPHFTKLVQSVLRKDGVALDIGANLGHNTVVMAKAMAPGGIVVAFEPLRIVYQQLCGNCFLNGLLNVYPLNLAIGETPGTVQMNPVNYFAEWVNVGETRVGAGGDSAEVRTIDSFNFSNVQFVKIDAQSYELDVLKGAARTIAQNRPLMFIEVENESLKHRNLTGEDIGRHLLSLNYLIIKIVNDYPVDCFCVPMERKDEFLPRLKDLIDWPVEIITPARINFVKN